MSREAERDSFHMVPETCPIVDGIMWQLQHDLMNQAESSDLSDYREWKLFERDAEAMFNKAVESIKEQTQNLRQALIQVIDQRDEALGDLADLKQEMLNER